jgi:hypothetical protein
MVFSAATMDCEMDSLKAMVCYSLHKLRRSGMYEMMRGPMYDRGSQM